MASAGPSSALPDSSASEISDLVEGLARARSNQDQTRLAGQGLQRLLRARVSVSTGGTFRAELRELVASAVLVPRSHHPPRAEPADRPGPTGSPGTAGSLLISAGGRHRTPCYLLWRAHPFNASEIEAADGIALTLIALHVRWEATEGPRRMNATPQSVTEPCGPVLTRRETVILEHLAEGLSAEAIGNLTGISPRTVRKHLQHVYAKLGAHDRLVAVEVARAAGLLGGGHGDPVRR
jgi:DNA-binding CsgD family transcriptional regulator